VAANSLAFSPRPAYDADSAVFREFPPEVPLEGREKEGSVRPRLAGVGKENDWA